MVRDGGAGREVVDVPVVAVVVGEPGVVPAAATSSLISPAAARASGAAKTAAKRPRILRTADRSRSESTPTSLISWFRTKSSSAATSGSPSGVDSSSGAVFTRSTTVSRAHRVSWVISTFRSLAWGSGGRPPMLADGSGSRSRRTGPRSRPFAPPSAPGVRPVPAVRRAVPVPIPPSALPLPARGCPYNAARPPPVPEPARTSAPPLPLSATTPVPLPFPCPQAHRCRSRFPSPDSHRRRSGVPCPDAHRRRPRGDPRRRRRHVPYAVVPARAVTPSRRRRAAWRGLALAFRQDVRELLIEVEVPVLRARGTAASVRFRKDSRARAGASSSASPSGELRAMHTTP